MGRLQVFGPREVRGYRRVIALKVGLKASRRFGVFEFGVAEDFATQCSKVRVVIEQFLSRVDVIVVVVILAVVVEPGLDAFGEILVVVHRRIFALPQPGGHGFPVGRFQARIKGWIDVDETSQMNVVREFVDQDALGRVRVAVISQQVFLAA